MNEIKINIYNALFFLILLLSIFPITNIAGFDLPVLYLLMPIGIFILMLVLLGFIRVPKITGLIIIFFFLILVEIFVSTYHGTITVLGNFDFPTDAIQYVARFITIVSFIVIFYHNKISSDTFIKYFLIILNIGMLIGILQWIPWAGREFFVTLYPFKDIEYQLGQLSNTMSGIRVHGIAQFATANGGLATFFFIFGFAIFKYYKKHYVWSVILMILSFLNIIASQARAGMLALVSAIIILYIIDIYVNRRSLKSTFVLVTTSILVYIIGLYLYNNGNPFMEKIVYRWEYLLFEEQGGGRVYQYTYFLALLKNPMDYLLGLSKQVVNKSAIATGIEIEPANIVITYGLLGFVLQYLLIFVLLIYFLRSIKNSIHNKVVLSLLVTAFVGLSSYQIFSIGYYFFREIRIGLFPWILMGVAIGVYERYRKQNLIKK